MKRFMFALGLLATVAISESEGGYVVIRLVLQAGQGAGGTGPGMMGPGGFPGMGPPKGMGGPPPGAGGFQANGSGFKGSGAFSGRPPGMGGPGGQAEKKPEIKLSSDPRQSIYVVVPYKNDITKNVQFYKKAPPRSHNPYWQPAITHPFGHANLMLDNAQIQLYMNLGPLAPKGTKTRASELLSKRLRMKRDADAQTLLDLASETLEQGFIANALTDADAVVAAVKERKARTTPQVDHFLKAYGQVKEEMAKTPRQRSDGDDWKERLGFAYPGIRDYRSQHYHLLYWEGMDTEAMRRVSQLEDNFKAFYLVNAFHGVALPMPVRPLVVILAKSPGDVRKLQHSLDGAPQVADGFFSPDHGIVVLSPERLDGISQSFNRQLQDMFRQGVSRKELLAGKGPRIDDKGLIKDSKKAEDVARMMTWVVVERYAEEESEWSTVSREGCRQLMHAIGLLPRHVALPQWLSEGSASFYQRPRGPVHFQGEDLKDYITIALTTGYGGPNYVRQRQFRELLRLKQFDAGPKQGGNPGLVLQHVITDAYFSAIATGLDIDNPKLPLPLRKKKPEGPKNGGGPMGPMGPKGPGGPPPGSFAGPGGPPPGAGGFPGMGGPPGFGSGTAPEVVNLNAIRRQRHEFLVTKAQATSWALYYYLARTNPEGLQRYFAELGKMPRDFPLDPEMQAAAFAKAFNLPLDQSAFIEFGAAWIRWMQTVPITSIDLALNDLTTSGGGSSGPGGPGGAPPGGPPPGAFRR